ncbi:1-phosphofructokinase family hexose kinase [Flavobacterium sp.]|uniref:1-phosphofructokinase family hexose kinase n=1 Tax=Flavobacterium sp. TaxID=239 RepID=UPI0026370D50|nr:1-phosphofructokinase family hexose kinase [Flavobacterium sp.]MDG2433828.1 1-phosphofructokinase family hexose kinase [Flavobacterium sp.]
MKKNKIITLTVNPALDKSAHFKGLVPEQKIRCDAPRFDAGGGGINVSKAIFRLGGESLAIFTAGGPTGETIKDLLTQEGIAIAPIEVTNWTRESFVAVDDNTNSQYRFGFPGAAMSTSEKDTILLKMQSISSEFLVISGSISEGLPVDFYSQIALVAKQLGIKVIADTSGESLHKILETGVYLIKPNVGELAKLVGVPSLEMEEVDEAAKKIISSGGAEIVVVSLGPQGAVLVTKDSYDYVPAPNVVKKSTVGAGDSMVGGMVWALSQNKSLKEVIRWGVACGSAATMNEGTQLFKFEDAKRLYDWLQKS